MEVYMYNMLVKSWALNDHIDDLQEIFAILCIQ